MGVTYDELLADWQQQLLNAPAAINSTNVGAQTKLEQLYAQHPALPKNLRNIPEHPDEAWAAGQLKPPGLLSRLGNAIAAPFDWFARETTEQEAKTDFVPYALFAISGILGAGGVFLGAAALGAGLALSLPLAAVGAVAGYGAAYLGYEEDVIPFVIPALFFGVVIGAPLHYAAKGIGALAKLGSNAHQRKLEQQCEDNDSFNLDCAELAAAARAAKAFQQEISQTESLSEEQLQQQELQRCVNLLEQRLIKDPNLGSYTPSENLLRQPNLGYLKASLKTSFAERIAQTGDAVSKAAAELDNELSAMAPLAAAATRAAEINQSDAAIPLPSVGDTKVTGQQPRP